MLGLLKQRFAFRATGGVSPAQLLSKLRAPAKQLRLNSTKAAPRAPNLNPQPPPPTGLRKLVKDYGYAALGVYLTLSAIDLPLCYLLVHLMGKEQIEEYENKVKQYFGYGKSDADLQRQQEIDKINEEAEAPTEKGALLPWFSWTEFAIAYGLHKSVLIFVRVPLTAMFTPAIVRTLQRWGFNIGSSAAGAGAAKGAMPGKPDFGTPVSKRNKWFSWFF